MPCHVRPPSRVRTTDVHGGVEQGAVPSTKPSAAESKVTDAGTKPLGTGPSGGPETGGGAGAAVTEDPVVAPVVDDPPAVVGVAWRPLGCPHAARPSETRTTMTGSDRFTAPGCPPRRARTPAGRGRMKR